MLPRRILEGGPAEALVTEYTFLVHRRAGESFLITPLAEKPSPGSSPRRAPERWTWGLSCWCDGRRHFLLAGPGAGPREFASPEECVAYCGTVREADADWGDLLARSGLESLPAGLGQEALWLPAATLPARRP